MDMQITDYCDVLLMCLSGLVVAMAGMKLVDFYGPMRCRPDTREGYERFLMFFALVSAVSPFIGLGGTVWRIMGALAALPQQADIKVLAGMLGLALRSTVYGLVAAIIGVTAYMVFSRLAEVRIRQLGSSGVSSSQAGGTHA